MHSEQSRLHLLDLIALGPKNLDDAGLSHQMARPHDDQRILPAAYKNLQSWNPVRVAIRDKRRQDAGRIPQAAVPRDAFALINHSSPESAACFELVVPDVTSHSSPL